jgi:hypothetical protein
LLRYGSAQGRWVIAAMVMASSVAGIDSTVVAVALPAIGRNLHAGFALISWICAAAFGCAAVLAAALITGPGRAAPAPRPALAATPVPQLACLPGSYGRSLG